MTKETDGSEEWKWKKPPSDPKIADGEEGTERDLKQREGETRAQLEDIEEERLAAADKVKHSFQLRKVYNEDLLWSQEQFLWPLFRKERCDRPISEVAFANNI